MNFKVIISLLHYYITVKCKQTNKLLFIESFYDIYKVFKPQKGTFKSKTFRNLHENQTKCYLLCICWFSTLLDSQFGHTAIHKQTIILWFILYIYEISNSLIVKYFSQVWEELRSHERWREARSMITLRAEYKLLYLSKYNNLPNHK